VEWPAQKRVFGFHNANLRFAASGYVVVIASPDGECGS
jgi:hypothetical protein